MIRDANARSRTGFLPSCNAGDLMSVGLWDVELFERLPYYFRAVPFVSCTSYIQVEV